MEQFSVVLPIITSALTTFLVWLMQERYKRKDSNKKAMRILMRKELKDIHEKAIRDAYVSDVDMGNFNEIYEIYHELGGNGIATVWKTDIEKLERKC